MKRLLIFSISALLLSSCYQRETLPKLKTSEPLLLDKIMTMYNGYKSEFSEAKEITVKQLKTDLQSKKIVFVDVREDYERKVSTIPNSISMDEFEENIESYEEYLIVVYCTIGYRSGLYTEDLNFDGLDARNLIGGVLLWAYEGLLFRTEDRSTTRRVHVYGEEWDLLPPEYTGVL